MKSDKIRTEYRVIAQKFAVFDIFFRSRSPDYILEKNRPIYERQKIEKLWVKVIITARKRPGLLHHTSYTRSIPAWILLIKLRMLGLHRTLHSSNSMSPSCSLTCRRTHASPSENQVVASTGVTLCY